VAELADRGGTTQRAAGTVAGGGLWLRRVRDTCTPCELQERDTKLLTSVSRRDKKADADPLLHAEVLMPPSRPDDTVTVPPSRTARRRWTLWTSAVAGTLILGTVGYFALTDNGPRLSGGGGGVSTPVSDERTPFLVEDIGVCLDSPGTVTITGVRPAKSEGGIVLQAFAVRPWVGGGYVGEPGTLAAAGYHPEGPQQVSTACSAGGGGTQLAIQIERTGHRTATLDEIAVDYLSDGYRHTADLDALSALCALHDQENSMCRRP
jgi:hypothetical protein